MIAPVPREDLIAMLPDEERPFYSETVTCDAELQEAVLRHTAAGRRLAAVSSRARVPGTVRLTFLPRDAFKESSP